MKKVDFKMKFVVGSAAIQDTDKKAINDTINSFYPKLWIINSYTFTFNASQVTYPLPDTSVPDAPSPGSFKNRAT